jgi:uncharacterized protein
MLWAQLLARGQGLRDSGVETGGPAAFGARDKRAFAAALDRVLTRSLRED